MSVYRVTVTRDDDEVIADVTVDSDDFWLHEDSPGGLPAEVLRIAVGEVM